MEGPTIYTKADIDIELTGYQYDPIVNELVDLIRALYHNSTVQNVGVSPTGVVLLALSPIAEETVQTLRKRLKDHAKSAYPALAAKYSQSVSTSWLDPKLNVPAPGMYMVIAQDDYCRKAVYYEGGHWEWSDTGKRADVLLYQPLPLAPEGMAYSEY